MIPQILFEDKDLIVINKPSGWITEKNPFEKSAESWVFDYLHKPNKKAPYLGVVHRLDKVTSGVLLFAKKKSILKGIQEQFANRSIQKTYWAWVEGVPKNNKMELINFISVNRKEKKAEIVAQQTKEAKNCSLKYEIIETKTQSALLEIKPKTGRFHQIRAQLAHIHHPIIGDYKYQNKDQYTGSIKLHAQKLVFIHPKTEKQIAIIADGFC